MNVSPVEGCTFSVCKSMKNIQVLTWSGGCAKYALKYIAKIEEQNYVTIDVDGQGRFTTRDVFIHNTKVASSKMGEDKERAKYDKMIQRWCTSLMETINVMLKYPEACANMRFIYIPEMPLALRAGFELDTNSNEEGEDRTCITSASDSIRQFIQLDQ